MWSKHYLGWLSVLGLVAHLGAFVDDFPIRPLVEVDQGKVLGKTMRTIGAGKVYHAFQGIPYAEPPVDDLRFMPPKPLQKWEGVFQATDDTKECPQKDAIFDHYPHGDEDCLVLNVYTPLRYDQRKFPVMFWIHGGGFASGSGGTSLFGPDYLIEEDVILVTANYRLGVLGFLNLEDETVTGNMGLKDVVLALNWVKNNIHAFGGDASSVTIFGNNAGGAIVSLLTQSPMSKGLFSRAICQSGVSKLPQLFGSKERQRAFTLAKLLRKNPSDSETLLKAFKNLTPYDLIKATPRTFDSTEVRDTQKNILPFGPSIERGNNETEAFLTNTPEEIFAMNKIPDPNIPMMIGFNSREAIVYLRSLINGPDILDKLNYNFQFSLPFRGLEFKYNSKLYNEVSEQIRKFYFENGIIKNDSVAEFVDYISDEIFYPVDKSLDEVLKMSRAPVYYYRFSYDGDLNFYKNAVLDDVGSVSGASNGDEICYLFKCARLNDVYEKMHANPNEDLLISKRMVHLWTNFAKYGNPTPSEDDTLDGVKWEPATSRNHEFLDINSNFTMGQNPRAESVAFWDRIFNTYSIDANEQLIKAEL